VADPGNRGRLVSATSPAAPAPRCGAPEAAVDDFEVSGQPDAQSIHSGGVRRRSPRRAGPRFSSTTMARITRTGLRVDARVRV